MHQSGRRPTAWNSCSRLKLQLLPDRIDTGLGAGFVGVAARRPGHADRSDQRTAGFDDQSAADDDGSGQIAEGPPASSRAGSSR